MNEAVAKYETLIEAFVGEPGVGRSQMFGKACLKVNEKAFVAQHMGSVIFKLDDADHVAAMGIEGAALWDPSGRGRPMKGWVSVPHLQSRHYAQLAIAALNFVRLLPL
jgi:hypothetical protein